MARPEQVTTRLVDIRIKDRLSTLFEQVAVRTVAGVIVAFILPLLAIVFGGDFSLVPGGSAQMAYNSTTAMK